MSKRPDKPGEQIQVRIHSNLLNPLDEWRKQNGNPSRPEAIRRILLKFFSKKGDEK